MDIKEILGAEFGDAESFLIKNKKDIIKEFYETNSSLTNPITGALLRCETKSGLVLIAASILTALSIGSGVSIVELILNIVRIGSGAITSLTAAGVLIIEIINYVKATKDYKNLLQMANYFTNHPEEMAIPMMFASIIMGDDLGDVHVIHINVNDVDQLVNQTDIINLACSDGSVVALPVDNFVNKAIALENAISMASYESAQDDLQRLHNLLEEYALNNGVSVENNIMYEALEELEKQVKTKIQGPICGR